jgi:hypothetical protein
MCIEFVLQTAFNLIYIYICEKWKSRVSLNSILLFFGEIIYLNSKNNGTVVTTLILLHTKNQRTSHHIKQTFVDELPLKIKFINREHNLLKILSPIP